MKNSFAILVTLSSLLGAFQVWSLPGKSTPQSSPALVQALNKDTIFAVGSAIPSKSTLSQCVDEAAKKLGIDINMKTDTKLLGDILENDMHLKDLTSVQSLFRTDLEAEQSLLPMLQQVRKGLTVTHPAVGATICIALKDPTTANIFTSPNPEIIKRTIHHMFLLEKIVNKLANDRAFMGEVNTHLKDKVNSMTPHKSFLGHIYDLFKAAGFFGVAKEHSINGAMNDYIQFREKNLITHEESEERKSGLVTNVMEATIADFASGFPYNAEAGEMLAKDHPSVIRIVGPNRVIEYVNRMEYAQLYETWNLAFITGNLDYLNMLYPKLLIPSVLLADANSYLYHRVLALSLSINFYLMASLQNKPRINFEGSRELAALWGHINIRYAKFLPPKKE
jgi:hypothetical protein